MVIIKAAVHFSQLVPLNVIDYLIIPHCCTLVIDRHLFILHIGLPLVSTAVISNV